ncbi:hypothetical protein GCM10007392_26130 [Saccharospirillum salsuginis]|uniref:Uncharacterized protein n=1 Tax=Saccharospirillum salsuginis TaxID=418750 RepID=A0A918N9X4_9GAMM|nr:hypothetical protein GCM10007392_26130 [Saccharospirillum salsuginis]
MKKPFVNTLSFKASLAKAAIMNPESSAPIPYSISAKPNSIDPSDRWSLIYSGRTALDAIVTENGINKAKPRRNNLLLENWKANPSLI